MSCASWESSQCESAVPNHNQGIPGFSCGGRGESRISYVITGRFETGFIPWTLHGKIKQDGWDFWRWRKVIRIFYIVELRAPSLQRQLPEATPHKVAFTSSSSSSSMECLQLGQVYLCSVCRLSAHWTSETKANAIGSVPPRGGGGGGGSTAYKQRELVPIRLAGLPAWFFLSFLFFLALFLSPPPPPFFFFLGLSASTATTRSSLHLARRC